MRIRGGSRSLLSHSILRIVLPFSLLVLGLLIAGALVYSQIITSLLVDRDRQMAILAASSVSEELEGYTRVLEALAGNPDLHSSAPETRAAGLENAHDALTIFNAGVALTDEDGIVQTATPSLAFPIGLDVSAESYFQNTRDHLRPAFSSVLTPSQKTERIIVIAAPILDGANQFAGTLMGAAQLGASPLINPVKNLIIGNDGHAYLVGQHGRVIYHWDATMIGDDYSHVPSVMRAIAGESGGLLRQTPTDERVVEGYAPIPVVGWGLIVQESWDTAVAPVQAYSFIVGIIAMCAVTVAVLVSWQAVRRTVLPIQRVADQIRRLADNELVETIHGSGISEIDALEQSFNRMAKQIVAYRKGLRRYIDAITHSQEEERRRIARELHDETVQNMIAINRRLELYQAGEENPDRLTQLSELQAMTRESVRGVRQISRDLRPLILEDLGLIPALRSLVSSARDDHGAIPQAEFKIIGTPAKFSSAQELALYRITQEALTNVRKHAHATSVRVTLDFESKEVKLEVVDDGDGFQLPASPAELAERGSFGLIGIQERVRAVGGTLLIDSAPEHGTRLRVTLPTDGGSD